VSDTTSTFDLLGAVSHAARDVARTLGSDGVAAVLLWGDPPEAEVVFDEGLPPVLCRAMGAAGGRVLAEALRRENRPLLVGTEALAGEEPDLAAALGTTSVPALAAFPLYAEAGIVGGMVVPVQEDADVDQARQEWRIACRSLAALQLTAAVAALRTLLDEDRRQPAGWADGVLVHDPWERVLFADGFFREFPGWNREDPFARSLNMLPGGALLARMKLSHPGALLWEEHLLPPVAGHGIPVALASLPLDLPGPGGAHARLVLVRDLRSDDQRGPDPSTRLLALGMRVAHASDELLQSVHGPNAAGALSDGSEPEARCRGIAAAELAPSLIHRALERVSGGKAREAVDMTRLAEDVLGRFGPEFAAERIRVFPFLTPGMPDVPGDPLAVARALRTMIHTARASLRPNGGTLSVRTWTQDGYAWAAVSDDGSGADGPGASGFRPLFAGARDDEGEIDEVAALAKEMGGRLVSEAHGSLWNRLTLTLPVERRAPGRPEGPSRPTASDPSEGEDGLRVLVVDDNAALRSVLRRYLERRGHQVTEAVDGDEAMDIVMAEEFDRMIVDVNMPGKTGPELYSCLEDTVPGRCGGTIFMTGGLLEDTTERFIEDSGCRSIKKPFDLGVMAQAVESF